MALFSIGLFVALAGSCNALSLRSPVLLPAAAEEQSQPLYIFMHIPVAGGRSVSGALRRTLGGVTELRGGPGPGSSSSDWTKEVADGFSEACSNSHVHMIAGHVSLKEVEPFLRDCKRPTRIVAIMRNPMERSRSWLLHQTKTTELNAFKERKHSVEERTNIANRMTYQLGDFARLEKRSINGADVLNRAKDTLSKAFFVLFTESLDTDFEAFSKKAGLKHVSLPHVDSDHQKKKAELTTDDEEVVKTMNTLDFELYDWAKKQFA